MSRFRELFPSGKPIIAMAHVPRLPAVPVLVNSGATSTSIGAIPSVADGCIVGSDLEVDGYTWNPVDPARARRFMEAARA